MARLSMVPMKLPRTTLLLVAALAGLGASARASETPFRPRLIQPAPEATLAAGSVATIAWDATGIPGNFDEWEAFLSLDGGRSYPLRITPHLDLAIRSFTWSVPALPGSEGSLLLRFGDERVEQRFAFARRFRIAGALALASPLSRALGTPPVLARSRGEAAEPEDEGVIAWVEGPRDGSSITQVAVGDETLSSGPPPVVASQRAAGVLSATPPRGDGDGLCPATAEDNLPTTRLRDACQPRLDRSADILLITRRRNI